MKPFADRGSWVQRYTRVLEIIYMTAVTIVLITLMTFLAYQYFKPPPLPPGSKVIEEYDGWVVIEWRGRRYIGYRGIDVGRE